jgi:uncharacterized coiled-coil protein SlyX
MLDRVIGRWRTRRARDSKSRGAPVAATVADLERRVAHLEAMIEGLQDAVHRETLRTKQQLEDLHHRTSPAEISKALSRDARERGL